MSATNAIKQQTTTTTTTTTRALGLPQTNLVVDLAFHEVQLDKELLVVQLLHLAHEDVDAADGLVVLALSQQD